MEVNHVKNISGTQKLAGSLIVGKLFALIATFTIPMFLTRFLTKADYGLYAQLYTVLVFLTGFFGFGISSNLYYYYPTANQYNRRIYVFQTLLLMFILSATAALVLAFPSLRYLLIGTGELNLYSSTIIILAVIMIPSNIIAPLYVVKNDHKTAIIYPLVEVILRACLVVIFVLIQSGVKSVFNAMITSAVLILLFILYYTFKEIGLNKIFTPIKIELLKNQISYSLPFGMAVSINTFARMFDKILCISYLSTATYATYAIAFYGIPGIQQIYDSLAQVAVIRMTENLQNGNKIEAHRIYKKMVGQTYSFSVPAILIVVLYAKKIITFLFTDKFIDSTHLFQAYLGTFLIVMLGVGLILRASGETKYSFLAYFLSALISVPSTFFLIKHFGLWGAMSGAIFSIVGPMLFMINKEMHIMESKLKYFLPWKQMLYISLISVSIFIPFLIIELNYSYGVIISGLLAILYLILVSSLELKCGLFILDLEQIKRSFMKFRLKIKTL